MTVRVLISDNMDPRAAAIFRERGIEVDEKPGLSPSVTSRERAKMLLSRALGPSKLLVDRDACGRFANDDSDTEGVVPDAVVLAETPEDIQATLAAARESGVPVTPRAAGTGRTGGAVPVSGGIVLSCIGMNRIKDIDRRERVAVVEPGVVLADLHAAVEGRPS